MEYSIYLMFTHLSRGSGLPLFFLTSQGTEVGKMEEFGEVRIPSGCPNKLVDVELVPLVLLGEKTTSQGHNIMVVHATVIADVTDST